MRALCIGALACTVLVHTVLGSEECGTATIEEPTVPEALTAYRVDMETFGTAEATGDEKSARTARASTRAVPRTATDQAGNTFSVSDRFCALEYPETCPSTWASGTAKPAGLECAGVPTVANAQCDADNMELYMGIPGVDDVTGALTVTMGVPITMGIVFMVLYLLHSTLLLSTGQFVLGTPYYIWLC